MNVSSPITQNRAYLTLLALASRQLLRNSGQSSRKTHVDVQKGEGALSLYQLKVEQKEDREVENRILYFFLHFTKC